MKTIECTLPDSLHAVLLERMRSEKTTCDHVIATALSQCFGQPLHTLFQVSTSGALVEGLYQGAVEVARILDHGDFGLGTFIDLDGEMVVLDGVCYQAFSDGLVTEVEGGRLIPYAIVTRFSADVLTKGVELKSFADVVKACDRLRTSANLFYAFRIDGYFSSIKMRVMKAVPEGTGIKAAAHGQQEFLLESQTGTLVGLWSPGFAGSFSVPGYHFHFLPADRKRGGHLLECKTGEVVISACAMHEMHVSLPETKEFLKADLSRDPAEDLRDAEQNHTE